MTAYLMAMTSVAVLAAPAGASPVSGGGVVVSRATATYSDGSSADRLYRIKLSGGGETYLRVACSSGGEVTASSIVSPRDAASGMASGKRMHKPFTITKELDRSSVGTVKGSALHWDIKENKGARVAADGGITAMDDWSAVTLHGSAGLCD
jgi:hypothetical protein